MRTIHVGGLPDLELEVAAHFRAGRAHAIEQEWSGRVCAFLEVGDARAGAVELARAPHRAIVFRRRIERAGGRWISAACFAARDLRRYTAVVLQVVALRADQSSRTVRIRAAALRARPERAGTALAVRRGRAARSVGRCSRHRCGAALASPTELAGRAVIAERTRNTSVRCSARQPARAVSARGADDAADRGVRAVTFVFEVRSARAALVARGALGDRVADDRRVHARGDDVGWVEALARSRTRRQTRCVGIGAGARRFTGADVAVPRSAVDAARGCVAAARGSVLGCGCIERFQQRADVPVAAEQPYKDRDVRFAHGAVKYHPGEKSAQTARILEPFSGARSAL
jgi:hypothetical protein